jgi:hypothetical protein
MPKFGPSKLATTMILAASLFNSIVDDRGNIKRAVLIVAAAITVLVSLWVHHLADFSFPVPWDDEAIFFFPAAAIAESGSIQSDSLNLERPVFYHPPGYPVALGLFLKLAPVSLDSARLFSWVLVMATYLCAIAVLSKFASWLFSLAATSAIFLSSHMTICGNIARPEALIIALAMAGFLALSRRRIWASMSFFCLASLIHPAAWIPTALALLAILREYRLKWPRPLRFEYLLASIAALCSLAMAAYLAWRWEWFWSDVQVSVNFLHQTWAQRLSNLATPRQLIPAMVALSLPFLTIRSKWPLFPMALIGLGFWFLQFYRPEMWYFCFTALFYALSICTILELVASSKVAGVKRLGTPLALVVLLSASYFQGHVLDPRYYPLYLWWRHMTIRPNEKYITQADIHAVHQIFASQSPAREPGLVRFFPGGDGALFHNQLPSGWIPYFKAFSAVPPSAIVIHQSSMAYPGFNEKGSGLLDEYGVDLQTPAHARDGTGSWFVHFLPP